MRKKEVNTNDMDVLVLLNCWGLSDFERNCPPVCSFNKYLLSPYHVRTTSASDDPKALLSCAPEEDCTGAGQRQTSQEKYWERSRKWNSSAEKGH